jgi:hypothetical protein
MQLCRTQLPAGIASMTKVAGTVQQVPSHALVLDVLHVPGFDTCLCSRALASLLLLWVMLAIG